MFAKNIEESNLQISGDYYKGCEDEETHQVSREISLIPIEGSVADPLQEEASMYSMIPNRGFGPNKQHTSRH